MNFSELSLLNDLENSNALRQYSQADVQSRSSCAILANPIDIRIAASAD